MKDYIIHKGCHYSNFFPRIYQAKDVMIQRKKIIFTDSCKYGIDEESCVNKLFGFCFGFGVHENSARFGWTYNKGLNEIFILRYVYNNGHLDKKKVFTCKIGSEHAYQISAYRLINGVDEKAYEIQFWIDGEEVSSVVLFSKKHFVTTLGPYFGGNNRAPHKITIKEL